MYGSFTEPVDFGSGAQEHPSYPGTSDGGGAIKIRAQRLVIGGTISADAPTNNLYGGGPGSGGSIYIELVRKTRVFEMA